MKVPSIEDRSTGILTATLLYNAVLHVFYPNNQLGNHMAIAGNSMSNAKAIT